MGSSCLPIHLRTRRDRHRTRRRRATRIIAQNGAGATYAAGLARAHAGGSYSDWYLPSKAELNKLWLNRVAIGGFASAHCWSSSEYNADVAWDQYFVVGDQGSHNKYATSRVRAVRAF